MIALGASLFLFFISVNVLHVHYTVIIRLLPVVPTDASLSCYVRVDD